MRVKVHCYRFSSFHFYGGLIILNLHLEKFPGNMKMMWFV